VHLLETQVLQMNFVLELQLRVLALEWLLVLIIRRLALIENLRQEVHLQNLQTERHLGKREFWELATRNL
jgi:hypothetical protein